MKKVLTVFLILTLLTSLFIIPVSAADEASLQSTYQNLQKYITEEYYGDLKSWNNFSTALNRTKDLLDKEQKTELEIQRQSELLKKNYVEIMFEAYDFSKLQAINDLFALMDPTLYTENTWSAFADSMEEVKKELDQPVLYGTDKAIDKEEFSKQVQEMIDQFAAAAITNFNELNLVLPQDFTKENLISLTACFSAFVTEEFYQNTDEWENFSDCLKDALALTERRRPVQADLNTAAKELLQSYQILLSEKFDYKEVNAVLARFESLQGDLYLQTPWNSLKAEMQLLSEKLDAIYIFGFTSDITPEEYEEYVNAIYNSFDDKAAELMDDLPTKESHNKLRILCAQNRTVSYSEDAKYYAQKLMNCAYQGEIVLGDATAGLKMIEGAISDIQSAKEELTSVEAYLAAQKSQETLSEQSHSRFLALSATIATVASLALAAFLSLKKYRKLDWTK